MRDIIILKISPSFLGVSARNLTGRKVVMLSQSPSQIVFGKNGKIRHSSKMKNFQVWQGALWA
jgi:hypothetical protein